jgi:hypothetical protein
VQGAQEITMSGTTGWKRVQGTQERAPSEVAGSKRDVRHVGENHRKLQSRLVEEGWKRGANRRMARPELHSRLVELDERGVEEECKQKNGST